MMKDNQRILNWLENEKRKDKKDVELSKKKYINEIRSFKKEEIFVTPKKLTLWRKIKMILGF